jgi:hypothetical protein
LLLINIIGKITHVASLLGTVREAYAGNERLPGYVGRDKNQETISQRKASIREDGPADMTILKTAYYDEQRRVAPATLLRRTR